MANVLFQDLGLIDYKQAWDYQEKLFNSIVELKIQNRKLSTEEQKPTPNYLLFCEHPHVFTLGKSGNENNLLASKDQLKNQEAVFYKINRGGDITYHGPGQIVGYPVFDLENFFTDIHKYLRYLEEAIILTLAEYRLKAGRIKGMTGVWLDHENPENARKICAMGVRCSRWVSMHGFALNINTNLSYFNNIIPCGITNKAVTSLSAELEREIDINEVKDKLKLHIASLFNIRYTTIYQSITTN